MIDCCFCIYLKLPSGQSKSLFTKTLAIYFFFLSMCLTFVFGIIAGIVLLYLRFLYASFFSVNCAYVIALTICKSLSVAFFCVLPLLLSFVPDESSYTIWCSSKSDYAISCYVIRKTQCVTALRQPACVIENPLFGVVDILETFRMPLIMSVYTTKSSQLFTWVSVSFSKQSQLVDSHTTRNRWM